MAALMKKFGTEQGIKDFIDTQMRTEYKHVRMKVGTYTGDAAATKAITGLGFKPTFLIVWNKNTDRCLAFKSSQEATQSFCIPSGADVLSAYLDDQIISLDADGFTVGDGTGSTNYFNIAENYVYVAFG